MDRQTVNADEREPGEAFCFDCPDHEGCMTGYPCGLVKRINTPRAVADGESS